MSTECATHQEVESLGVVDVDGGVTSDARLDGVDVSHLRVTLPQLLDKVAKRLLDLLSRLHLHALEGRVRREPDSDTVGTDGVGHGARDFKREPGAVLDRAAVLVGAVVRDGLEELVEEVSVGAARRNVSKGLLGSEKAALDALVDFNTITTSFLDEELGSTRIVVDVVLLGRNRVSRRLTSSGEHVRCSPGSPAWKAGAAWHRPRTECRKPRRHRRWPPS